MTITDAEVEAALDAIVNGGAPVMDYLDFSASDAKEFGVLLPDGENFSVVDIVRHDQWRATGRVIIKAALLAASQARALSSGEVEMAWACVKCNSPRSVDPCPKCGTALTKPADGWEWPTLPDIDRIRSLAREVGYAIGVHGSLERDLDLIAVPWQANAVGPLELAEHIAYGLGGNVVDFERQDKPCGRWSCNIHTPDWTKMIDLSVMPPPHPPSKDNTSEQD